MTKTLHVYESHLGGVYLSEEYVESYTYKCEQCGESDWYVGIADSLQSLINILKEGSLSRYNNEYLNDVWKDYVK